MTGALTQRNEIALLRELYDSGAIPRLSQVSEIRHQDGCPMQVTARNLQCWCVPRVYVLGLEVTSA